MVLSLINSEKYIISYRNNSFSGSAYFWYRSTDKVLHNYFTIKFDTSMYKTMTVYSTNDYSTSLPTSNQIAAGVFDVSNVDSVTVTFDNGPASGYLTAGIEISTTWSVNFE